jgi:hypothetical protein
MIFVPVVIPAKAGIHASNARAVEKWAPARAGATIKGMRLIDKTLQSEH